MITPEFLQSCTDEQINIGVAWLAFKEWGVENKHKRKALDYYACHGLLNSINAGLVNYCSNPNDAWPIIKSERINLISPPEHRHEWKACATLGGGNWSLNDFTATNENPLRAAMEVYILMSTQS